MLRARQAPRRWTFADEGLRRVREGMNKVVNEPGGTAYALRITEPGFEMAGKTGTAQVRAYTEEQHGSGVTKNAALDWKLRDHGLFIGFAPVAKPQICHAPASSSMAATVIPRCRWRAISCSSPRSAIRWASPPPIR